MPVIKKMGPFCEVKLEAYSKKATVENTGRPGSSSISQHLTKGEQSQFAVGKAFSIPTHNGLHAFDLRCNSGRGVLTIFVAILRVSFAQSSPSTTMEKLSYGITS